MAEIAFIDDLKQIKSLWLNVFAGDDDKTVEYFYKNCVHKKCLGAFCDDKPVSMLFLVDCCYCEKKGAYVYAVCTLPEFRGRGISGSLIEYSKSLGYDFLWLIPASESLFCFYSRFGFETKLYSGERRENRISFNESDEIVFDFLFDGSDFEYPKGMIYSALCLPDGGTGLDND